MTYTEVLWARKVALEYNIPIGIDPEIHRINFVGKGILEGTGQGEFRPHLPSTAWSIYIVRQPLGDYLTKLVLAHELLHAWLYEETGRQNYHDKSTRFIDEAHSRHIPLYANWIPFKRELRIGELYVGKENNENQ